MWFLLLTPPSQQYGGWEGLDSSGETERRLLQKFRREAMLAKGRSGDGEDRPL